MMGTEGTEKHDRRTIVMVLIAAALLWAPVLGLGPLSDDHQRIVEAAGGVEHQLAWFTEPLPGVRPPLPDAVSPKLYRPVWRMAFVVDRALLPMGWWAPRLLVVLVHLLGTMALWGLLRSYRLAPSVAVGAAALFAVNPWQVEAVGWVSAQGVGLAMLFVLLAGQLRTRPRLAFALLILAGSTRESGLLAPLMAACWLFFDDNQKNRGFVVAAAGVALGFAAMRVYLFNTPIGGFTDLRWLVTAPGGVAILAKHALAALSPLPGPVVGTAGVLLGAGISAVLGALALRSENRKVAVGALGWLIVANLPYQRVTTDPFTGAQGRFAAESAAPLALLWALGIATLPKQAQKPLGLVMVVLLALTTLARQHQLGAAIDESTGLRSALASHPGSGTVAVPEHHLGFPLRPGLWPWAARQPWTATPTESPWTVVPEGEAADLHWCGPLEGLVPGCDPL